MRRTWSLRGLRRLAAIAIVALAAAYLALPLLASTRLVRDSIALELSEWSGYRVSIGAAPEVSVWPGFRATLSAVTLSDWSRADGRPVITVDELELHLSPFAALRGDVEFSAARFVRPVLYLPDTGAGVSLPALPLGSRIARSVLTTRVALATNAGQPDLADLPADAFGSVEIVDATIATGTPSDHSDLVTDISGNIDLPALNLPGRIAGTGTVNDEPVSIDIHAGQPLLLLAGGLSQVSAHIESRLLNASFDGAFQVDEKIVGSAKFSTPSAREGVSWIDARLGQGMAETPLSLSASLSGSPRQLKLEHVDMTIGASEAVGALHLAVVRSAPSLSGTLAFESLDLDDALAVFNRYERPGGAAGWLNWSSVDLRVSAAQATAGTLALTDVAASVNIHDRRSAFDISDATALGGTLQAGLRLDDRQGQSSMGLSVRGSDIDGAMLGQALGLPRLVPAAQGSFAVDLKGPPGSLSTMPDVADGSITANFAAGHFEALDLASFRSLLARGGFFQLDNVTERTLEVQRVDFKAAVKAGVATLDIADVETADRRLVLSGLAPINGPGLALTGAILPLSPADAEPEARFFVGGSWGAPVISSTVPGNPPE